MFVINVWNLRTHVATLNIWNLPRYIVITFIYLYLIIQLSIFSWIKLNICQCRVYKNSFSVCIYNMYTRTHVYIYIYISAHYKAICYSNLYTHTYLHTYVFITLVRYKKFILTMRKRNNILLKFSFFLKVSFFFSYISKFNIFDYTAMCVR